MTFAEGYLLSALAGGSWAIEALLERNGKDHDAKIAHAIGYGAIFAIAVRLGQEVFNVIRMHGLW